MAVANADGSIILSTKVDTSGINKGMSQIQGKATGLTKTISKLGAAIASAFAIQKIIQFSNESASLATQTEASVQRLVDIYGSASDSVGDFIDANARALGMSKSAAASFSSVYGNLFSVWADQATNAELTNRYLNMTAVVASKTGRTVEDVQERIRSGLLGNTEAIEDLGIFVNVKTIEMTDAFQRMANGKSWEQLDAYTQQQIRSMAILEQATAKYGDEVADTSATIRNRYKAAYEDFQNSWGNIVNTVLLPVLEILTKVFDIATRGLNNLSGRSGQILENSEGLTETSEQTAENIDEQTKNQKELNKEMKKTLAGFDEIQILSSNTSTSGTNNVDILEQLGIGVSSEEFDGAFYVTEVNETLSAIMGIVALSLVAVGLILLFTGAGVGYGIGFIIAGAGTLGITMASVAGSDIGSDVIQMLTTIMSIAGGALVALGIILIMVGSVAMGVGFIAAGAASIIGSVGSLVGFDVATVENVLSTITGIAGGAMLALGIILLVFGVTIPIAIGLIAAGAISLVSAVGLNFNAVIDAIKGPIAAIMAIVGAAMLVIGIILVCTGVGIPLGIALIAAGAVALVTPIALNADAIVSWISKVWDAVKSFWNRYVAPVFTAKFWLDLAKNCGNGLIGGFEAAINGIISMFEMMINWIVDGLNKISFDIPDWLGGGTFGINLPRTNFGRVSIPRLAQGAVIPPNKEFLAVLGDQKQGTNIETPLATMVQAFNMALNSRGNDTVKEEHYYLDENEVMRVIYKLAKQGERAQGEDLLESW